MKHFLLTAAAAAMVLALGSCAKTEVTDVPDSRYIGFDNAYVGNPTKAGVVTTETIDNFYVYATKTVGGATENDFFNNEKVYLSNGVFVYDNLKLWEAATYKFAAYSNGGNAGVDGKLEGVSFDGTSLAIADYNCDAVKDLVVSTKANSIDAANDPVQFTFAHALAMVKFTLKNGIGNNDIVISNFSVTGVNNTADLTVAADNAISWGEVTGETTLSDPDGFTSTQALAGESEEFVVIPRTVAQDVDNLTISFTATITVDGAPVAKELTATIDDYAWEPGLRYNYVATITGTDLDVIEFDDPIVSEWADYTDVDNGEMDIK